MATTNIPPFPMDPETTCFRCGGFTWYKKKDGSWTMRVSKNSVGNPSRSTLQDAGRRRIKNAQNLWTAMKRDGWTPRFQLKRPRQNDYSCFTALALQGINIYLTEAEAKNYAAILLPLTVADGTLPAIGTEFDGVGVRSDISVGDLAIGPETQVGELAMAIMTNNHGFVKGDTITFVAGNQAIGPVDGFPHASFRSCLLPLNPYDKRLLKDLPASSTYPHSTNDSAPTEEAFCIRDGFVASTVTEGVCTWVHERVAKERKREVWYCSRQTFWCRNEELIERYSSQAALDAATASYGKVKDPGTLRPKPTKDEVAGKI